MDEPTISRTRTPTTTSMARPAASFLWKWKRSTWLGVLGILGFMSSMCGISLVSAFFGDPPTRSPANIASLIPPLLVLVVLCLVLPIVLLAFAARRIIADQNGVRVSRGLGPAIVLPRDLILGVRPRPLVTEWSQQGYAGKGIAVRLARAGRKDVELPHIGMDHDDVRDSLAAIFGWAPQTLSLPDEALLQRLGASLRDSSDGAAKNTPRIFEAKPVSPRIGLAIGLFLAFVGVLVGARAAGLPLDIAGETSSGVRMALLWAFVALNCSGVTWPWLLLQFTGGQLRRLVIDDHGIERIYARRVERWSAEQIHGVRVSIDGAATKWPHASLCIWFADPASKRGLVALRESNYRVEPGQLAAELLLRYGEAIRLPAKRI